MSVDISVNQSMFTSANAKPEKMSSHVDDNGVSNFVINAVVLFHQMDMHFVILKSSPGMLNKYKISKPIGSQ